MAETLFKRACRVTVDKTQIEGLRVQFKIHKSHAKEPNTCELVIFGLSEQARAEIQGRGQRVIVEAGYGSNLAQVFSGDSTVADHTHDGPDWITKVQCANGERAYRFTPVAGSFKPGTAVADVFSALAKATGLDARKAEDVVRKATSRQFAKGYSFSGRVSTELDKLLTGRGLQWSIQDNALLVTEVGKHSDASVISLDADSGLIGSPEHGSPDTGSKPGKTVSKQSTVKIKSLLQPSFLPAGRVRLNAEAIKGTFRILTVDHEADTWEGPWYSSLETVQI